MKKKILSGFIVTVVVALAVVNFSMGMDSHWFESFSLVSVEGMAQGEDSSEWTKLQVGLCPQGIGLGKKCVPSPFYESHCNKMEEIDCGKSVPGRN